MPKDASKAKRPSVAGLARDMAELRASLEAAGVADGAAKAMSRPLSPGGKSSEFKGMFLGVMAGGIFVCAGVYLLIKGAGVDTVTENYFLEVARFLVWGGVALAGLPVVGYVFGRTFIKNNALRLMNTFLPGALAGMAKEQ